MLPIKSLLLVVALTLSGSMLAMATNSANGDLSSAKAQLVAFLKGSGLTIKDAQYLSSLGLYEFVIDGNRIIYLDKKMENIIIGDIINIENKQNYTENRINELEKVDFSALPLNQAIEVKQGSGEVAIAVFTDPDCPFCVKLEKDLQKINDITVYNFLAPIDSLHPNAKTKSIQIWCQAEEKKAQVWTYFMRAAKSIPAVKTCSNPIDKNIKLADKLGLDGTPVIILPNGELIKGYLAFDNFKKVIDQFR